MAEENAPSGLSRTIEPLCTRHDHILRFDGNGISWREGPNNEGALRAISSYRCGYFGCSVRYTPQEGYFTVEDTPDRPHFIEEPGANVFQCPQHGTWMYRSREQDGSRWKCGVEGCNHSHDEKIAVGMTG